MREKEQQPALTVEEQIENLHRLNLTIEDDEQAKQLLNRISYFRLIKAFSLGLKPPNGVYQDGTTFSQIVDLYQFNCDLRYMIFPLIEDIEINLRCRVANCISDRYGVLGYENPDNFINREYHDIFLKDIHQEIDHNSKAPFVRNFKRNYVDGKIPMYALVELFSFGTLSKFYKNMKSADKKAVAQMYHVGYTYLESWIESISYVRNICAHYGRLYNVILSKKPQLYQQYTDLGIDNTRIYGVLICIKQLLPPEAGWSDFLNRVDELFKKYPMAKKEMMGFPENWKAILQTDVQELREKNQMD